jgi:hypothetical protein
VVKFGPPADVKSRLGTVVLVADLFVVDSVCVVAKSVVDCEGTVTLWNDETLSAVSVRSISLVGKVSVCAAPLWSVVPSDAHTAAWLAIKARQGKEHDVGTVLSERRA